MSVEVEKMFSPLLNVNSGLLNLVRAVPGGIPFALAP
jgi:hypothetical protein